MIVEDSLTRFPQSFVCFDIEGNGYFGNRNRIVEVAILQYIDGFPQQGQHDMYRSSIPITNGATNIHGIHSRDVANKRKFSDVEGIIRSLFVDADVVVGHSVAGDIRLVQKSIPEFRPKRVFDTLRISRAILRKLASHKLQDLMTYFGLNKQIEVELQAAFPSLDESRRCPHSAAFDVICTVNLLRKLSVLAREQPFTPDLFD